jgi:hypothetical protein
MENDNLNRIKTNIESDLFCLKELEGKEITKKLIEETINNHLNGNSLMNVDSNKFLFQTHFYNQYNMSASKVECNQNNKESSNIESNKSINNQNVNHGQPYERVKIIVNNKLLYQEINKVILLFDNDFKIKSNELLNGLFNEAYKHFLEFFIKKRFGGVDQNGSLLILDSIQSEGDSKLNLVSPLIYELFSEELTF